MPAHHSTTHDFGAQVIAHYNVYCCNYKKTCALYRHRQVCNEAFENALTPVIFLNLRIIFKKNACQAYNLCVL